MILLFLLIVAVSIAGACGLIAFAVLYFQPKARR